MSTFATVLVFAFVCAFFVTAADNEGRVVGGAAATDGQYPYQVSLRTPRNKHFCGGSIINEEWILTAAHCVYRQSASAVSIVVGTNFLNSGGTAYDVSDVIWHEAYNPQFNINDIALIRTNTTIMFDAKVAPIPLSTTNTPSGTPCILSGWGLTSFPSQQLPNSLQHIVLTTQTLAYCAGNLPGFPIFVSHICTQTVPGRGACQGDSGGPLVYNGEQVGIVSWGIPCARGQPDLFTSVAFYRSWIRKTAEV